jgi:phosphoribosyl 1,2-cyclic phosphate phosphodiesterase
MTLKLTILGCGSSGGVPRPASGWGACDPNNPKNRRRRCSIMLERRHADQKTVVIVDTSPDLREQLINANVRQIDSVLYTHDHADHTHGIDDVRPVVLHMRKIIPTYMTQETSESLHRKFSYCYVSPAGSDYPPIVKDFRLIPGHEAAILGAGGTIRALPFTVHHGAIDALGFRFGNVAYTPDLNGIPDESLEALTGLDLWIIDALRHSPHPSHFTLSEALKWIETMKPKRAVLTNLHTDLDYDALRNQLPEHVTPAFDGMVIDVTGNH